MLGLPIPTSSHAVGDCCNKLLLKPLVVLTQARYFKRVFKLLNPIIRVSAYNLREGYLSKSLFDHFKNVYSTNFALNELDVLTSRLYWVQRHEIHKGREL